MGLLSRLYRLFKMHKKVSHGICWECQDSQLKKLQKFADQKYKAPVRRRNRLKEMA